MAGERVRVSVSISGERVLCEDHMQLAYPSAPPRLRAELSGARI